MNMMVSCEYNIDTACVELKYSDGSMLSIDTIAVENEYADNMYGTVNSFAQIDITAW